MAHTCHASGGWSHRSVNARFINSMERGEHIPTRPADLVSHDNNDIQPWPATPPTTNNEGADAMQQQQHNDADVLEPAQPREPISYDEPTIGSPVTQVSPTTTSTLPEPTSGPTSTSGASPPRLRRSARTRNQHYVPLSAREVVTGSQHLSSRRSQKHGIHRSPPRRRAPHRPVTPPRRTPRRSVRLAAKHSENSVSNAVAHAYTAFLMHHCE